MVLFYSNIPDTVHVPAAKRGKVIGAGGYVIKGIQEETGHLLVQDASTLSFCFVCFCFYVMSCRDGRVFS